MTSPLVRRQREHDRQGPIPQPNFGGPVNMGPMVAAGPYAPVQQRVNWQESLEQGFQARQAQRLQNRGGRHQRRIESTPMAAGPSAPTDGRVNYQERLEQDFRARHNQRLQNHNEGTSMAAGPSAPIEGRVNYQERLEQDFRARHNQRLQNHGGSRQDQTYGGSAMAQPFMQRQERYAEEERQHAEHLHDIQLQRQIDHDQEVLQHQ